MYQQEKHHPTKRLEIAQQRLERRKSERSEHSTKEEHQESIVSEAEIIGRILENSKKRLNNIRDRRHEYATEEVWLKRIGEVEQDIIKVQEQINEIILVHKRQISVASEAIKPYQDQIDIAELVIEVLEKKNGLSERIPSFFRKMREVLGGK